jgi:hypothetical protein
LPEAKSYKNDPEILTMTNLASSYHYDIIKFEKVLKTNHRNIKGDPFLKEHSKEPSQSIQTKYA